MLCMRGNIHDSSTSPVFVNANEERMVSYNDNGSIKVDFKKKFVQINMA